MGDENLSTIEEQGFIAPKIPILARVPIEKENDKMETFRNNLITTIIDRSKDIGHPELGLCLVRDLLKGEINEEEVEAYKNWQPTRAEQIAGQELSEALMWGFKNQLGRLDEFDMDSTVDLRMEQFDKSPQDTMDFRQGEMIAYSMLLEQSELDPRFKENMKTLDPNFYQEWTPLRNYDTILPGIKLVFESREDEQESMAKAVIKRIN